MVCGSRIPAFLMPSLELVRCHFTSTRHSNLLCISLELTHTSSAPFLACACPLSCFYHSTHTRIRAHNRSKSDMHPPCTTKSCGTTQHPSRVHGITTCTHAVQIHAAQLVKSRFSVTWHRPRWRRTHPTKSTTG
jgi:hypothetical protein